MDKPKIVKEKIDKSFLHVGESKSRGDDRGRGDSSQPGSSQADSGDLGTGESEDVEGTAAAAGSGREAGLRSPGNDVEGERQIW